MMFVTARRSATATQQGVEREIGVVLIFTTLSYIIFAAVIKLRKSHPHARRPYRSRAT